jgi:hypothetical protein
MAVHMYAVQDVGLRELYEEICDLENQEQAYIYVTKAPPKPKR